MSILPSAGSSPNTMLDPPPGVWCTFTEVVACLVSKYENISVYAFCRLLFISIMSNNVFNKDSWEHIYSSVSI